MIMNIISLSSVERKETHTRESVIVNGRHGKSANASISRANYVRRGTWCIEEEHISLIASGRVNINIG